MGAVASVKTFAGEFATPESEAMRLWAKRVLIARSRRAVLFPGDLFADPCWDMLIELQLAELERAAMTTSALCLAARVPVSTALRRIAELEARGFLRRHKDDADWRRNLVSLTPKARHELRQYFLASESGVA